LRIGAIDLFAPVSGLEARFRLAADAGGSGSGSVLTVERAEAGVLGGRIATEQVTLDPAAERLVLPVDLRGLQLDTLLGLIDAEGVSGDGALSGRVPIAIGAGTVAVEDAELSADGPGILRIRSEQLSDLLGQANEDVAMVSRVLEDFHYESLTMQIDKPAGGNGRVVLHMLGQNPAVLEGQPFQFNINIDSNVDDLLDALTRIYGRALGAMNRALENLR
jgi:hypothetical protein